MSALAPREAAVVRAGRPAEGIDPATAAWLAAIPCAALAALAVLVLGPPLGSVLFPARPPFTLLSRTGIAPEPVEQTRYLVAATIAPLLLALATAALARRSWAGRAAQIGAVLAQIAGLGLLVACVIGQHDHRFGRSYFTAATFAVAGAIAVLVIVAARTRPIRDRLAAWLRDTPGRRAAALLAAALATAIWVLPAINSTRSIAWSIDPYDPAFVFDEAFAVLNGLTPLVDFSAQYGSLWQYVAVLPLLAFGKTLLVFTLALSALSAAALLAVFDLLRRAARSALGGLLLFLPFLATSYFIVRGSSLVRFSFGTYFPMFPLRYGGAYLLAWLVARRLDGREGAPLWPLFAVAGLVALNDTDFGVAALAATAAALVWATLPWRRRALARFAAGAGSGLLIACALVSALTLARAGALPQPARMVAFARIYAIGGFTLLPLPAVIGLPLAIFLTHVAAIGAATVRRLRREPNRVLTGMLAWAGVFGLGSAAYYVGRTDPDTLQATFSAWALSLALLALVAVRHFASAPRVRTSVAAFAALAGVGVSACSLAQMPVPWAQVARVERRPPGVGLVAVDTPYAASRDPAVRRFVSSIAGPGGRFMLVPHAAVALFGTTGHMLADAYGLRDVVPFTGIDSLHTAEQLDEAIAALRRAGGNTVLIPPFGEGVVYRALARRGFELLTTSGLRHFPSDGQLGAIDGVVGVGGLTKWVDTR